MKNKLYMALGFVWLAIALFFCWVLITRMTDTDKPLFNTKLNDGSITISIGDLSLGDINTLYKSYNFSKSDVDELKVELVSSSFHIEPYAGDDISVELYGNWNEKIEPEVKVAHNKLSIRKPSLSIHTKGNTGSRKVVVKVPDSIASRSFDADINTVSGSIHTTDIAFGTFDADTTSGSIHVDGTIDTLKANTVSGSIHVNGICENLSCDSVSGNIHITSDKPLTGKNHADTVSGSIHITIPEESGFEFEWNTLSGSVNNDFYRGKCGKSGSQIVGDGNTKIKTESVSGSIHLNMN